MQVEKLYTVEEIAENLRVSKDTVRLWIRIKKLPAKKIGKNWRISEKEVKEFLQN